MFDKAKAVENARAKLANQTKALQSTLAEIDYIQKTEPTAVALIKALKIKRDRQQNAIEASEQLIRIYEPEIPGLEEKPKKQR